MKKQKFSLKGWQKFLFGFSLAWAVGVGVELKLNGGGAWAIVRGLPSAIASPVALPVMSYQEAFRSKEVWEAFSKAPDQDYFELSYGQVGQAGKRKGLLFGLLQVAAFYFPFLFLPSTESESSNGDMKGGSDE